MEVRRDPRSVIFFIILILLITNQEPQIQQTPNLLSRYDELLRHEWGELDVLNRTRYGDFDPGKDRWLNITGLNEEDGFAWDLLETARHRAKHQANDVLGDSTAALLDGTLEGKLRPPVYRNISGYVEGEWFRSSLGRVRHPSDLNLTTHPEALFPITELDRNLTGSDGRVRLHFTETEGKHKTDENRTISEISARVVIGDDGSTGGRWWEFLLNGVHFPDHGGVVLTTTSDRFAGIFALPHFQLSPHMYSVTQRLLNRTIQETIERQQRQMYPFWNPWSSAVESNEGEHAHPHCELVLFLQQHPLQFQTKSQKHHIDMDWLEQELRYPTGAPLPRRSRLAMSMTGFSPDCGFVIESKGPPSYSPSEYTHLVGAKSEVYKDRARIAILAFAIALGLLISLLKRQLKDTSTPSTRNRVSFYTIYMLALGDGFGFLTFVFMPLFLDSSQLILYVLAFLSAFSLHCEVKFLLDIWTVQATERMRQSREQASTSTRPTPSPGATTPDPPPPSAPPADGGLPLPATAARSGGATPVIIAPDQDDPDEDATTQAANAGTTAPTRSEFGAIYTRFGLGLVMLFFFSLHASTARATFRGWYFNTLAFCYLSFWCPQIYRNVMRNCRKALRWDFVVGQSVVRILPIAYLYAVPNNVLFTQTDLRGLAVLAGWIWIQMFALGTQELLGPRFFIRESWAPPAYDYHPILREDEEGGMMPIGSSQAQEEGSPTTSKAGESKTKGTRLFDCSICAADIEVPVVPSGTANDGGPGLSGMMLQRRAYMVTPCRHIFHTPCLEGWMRYRLQCPNCREVLPPL